MSRLRISNSGANRLKPSAMVCLLFQLVWPILVCNTDENALAQAPPITSSGLNTQVSGPIARGGQTQYNITGGTRSGGGQNLFHGFGNFSVGTGDIANFLNTPVNGSLPFTSNILGRVTGRNTSNIYGTIQTTGFEPGSSRRARR